MQETSTKANIPAGLFARIIRRLGLEKQLGTIKKYLGFSIIALAVFFVLFSFALLGFRAVMDETSLGPLMSLAVSDPMVVVRHGRSFTYSLFELMPGMNAALVLFTIGFLMLFIRLAIIYGEKFSSVTKSIQKIKENDPN